MARKAKVESVTQKGPLALNDEARSVAELMVNNLCEKCSVFAAYRRATTINIGILRQALQFLDVKLDTYHEPDEEGTFPACESHRQKKTQEGRGKGGARQRRGQTAMHEIVHEAYNAGCLYNERRPFLRLLRYAFAPDGEFRLTPGATS